VRAVMGSGIEPRSIRFKRYESRYEWASDHAANMFPQEWSKARSKAVLGGHETTPPLRSAMLACCPSVHLSVQSERT
jgi:hypothetical protein